MKNNQYKCPVCNCCDMTLRYEASYVYSYILDEDAPGLKNEEEFRSFLYDRREQKDNRTYIECNHCKTQYPYELLDCALKEKTEA